MPSGPGTRRGCARFPQREQEREKARLRKKRPDLVRQYERELREAEVLRQALTRGPFPGMATGDPDLYKAFCWRFWQLARPEGGRIGVVLPRSALSAKGSTEFRQAILGSGQDISVTMLLNNRQWVFEDVHPQYTIGLLSLAKARPGNPKVAIRGPYSSLDRYHAGMEREPAVFDGEQVRSWNDTASLPLLPSEESIEIFAQLRKAPRLDLDDGRSWRARPHTRAARHQRQEVHGPEGQNLPGRLLARVQRGILRPVDPGHRLLLRLGGPGEAPAGAAGEARLVGLQAGKLACFRSSTFEELRKKQTLPCLHARIAFRDVSRATDSRTVRTALVPPNIFLTNKAPVLCSGRAATSRTKRSLLGILSSLPLDWYARRFVEIQPQFLHLQSLPHPAPRGGPSPPPAGDPARRPPGLPG